MKFSDLHAGQVLRLTVDLPCKKCGETVILHEIKTVYIHRQTEEIIETPGWAFFCDDAEPLEGYHIINEQFMETAGPPKPDDEVLFLEKNYVN
jgi:hypothetical protein